MKKLIFLLLTIGMTINIWADDFSSGGIYYNITSSEAPYTVAVTYTTPSFTSDNSYSGLITIPASVEYSGITYAVTSIGDSAFYLCSRLTAITIPSSVLSIGCMAFSFSFGLTDITISEYVKNIGIGAFAGCPAMISVESKNSNYSAYDGVLYNKNYTTIIQCPTSKIGSFSIPSTVTNIGREAFYYSNLTTIAIPASVTSICSSAFSSCFNLTTIAIPESVTSIGDSAFYTCNHLTSITIPEKVMSIGYNTFRYCTALIIVASNNSYYSGYEGVLYDKNYTTLIQCPISKTGSFSIPSTVTTIGDYAFVNCLSLTAITIPSSVISIGSMAFFMCTGLIDISIPESVRSIGIGAFAGCPTMISVESRNSNYSAYDGVLYNKNYTTIIQCPTSKIGSFTIPTTVVTIGDYAFYNSKINVITIPSAVTSIGNSAFRGCSLITIAIPSAVTSIGYSAFRLVNSLTAVSIPASVTSIGSMAFADCINLKKITVKASVLPTLESNVFYRIDYKKCQLIVSPGKLDLYKTADQWKNFVSIVEGVPVVVTTVPTEITNNKITTGGSIDDDWAYLITERGVCWSTTSKPSVNDNKTINGNGIGTFQSIIIGLLPSTKYHIRAYATTSLGTYYGSDLTFTTLNNTAIDENSFESLKIYPNPSTGKLFLKSDNTDKLTVNLYDIMGKMIYSDIVSQSGLLFDVSTYGLKGLYLIQLVDKAGVVITEQKLVFE